MTNGKQPRTDKKVKRLSADDIYELTQEILQEHFKLDREGCQYNEQDIWDVLIAAAVERMTLETASDMLNGPSPNTTRNAIKGILPDDEKIDELETKLNTMLVSRLPPKLLHKQLPCAVDFVLVPYHGQHEEEDEAIRRGRAKSGTTHFHAYATLYTVKYNKRYTLALTMVRKSDKALEVLKRLQNRVETVKFRLKRLLLDREFDNNGVIEYLKTQSFPAIIPLTIRGKTGGTRALLKGRKSHSTSYTRRSQTYSTQTFNVAVACKYSKGRYKRQGLYRFAYVVIGTLKLHPLQIYQEYRFRFGIETSYRLMNQVRARTTSKSPALRLFFAGIAFVMLNLWTFVKWAFVFSPRQGGRKILHSILPLARWRLWLWEVVKLRLGFSLYIFIPV